MSVIICFIENEIYFVFLFNSCLLVIIQMNTKMIPSQPLDQPSEENGSRCSARFGRCPIFMLVYWIVILFMNIMMLGRIFILGVCAQHFINILRSFLYPSQMPSNRRGQVGFCLFTIILSSTLLLIMGTLIRIIMHLLVRTRG